MCSEAKNLRSNTENGYLQYQDNGVWKNVPEMKTGIEEAASYCKAKGKRTSGAIYRNYYFNDRDGIST